MTSRILPPEEWPRLAGTDAETVWPHLHHADDAIVVVEDGDAIIGCTVLMRRTTVHADCVWVRPDHRGKVAVARALWRAVERVAREDFCAAMLSVMATLAAMKKFLQRRGATHVPGEAYLWALKPRSSSPE